MFSSFVLERSIANYHNLEEYLLNFKAYYKRLNFIFVLEYFISSSQTSSILGLTFIPYFKSPIDS